MIIMNVTMAKIFHLATCTRQREKLQRVGSTRSTQTLPTAHFRKPDLSSFWDEARRHQQYRFWHPPVVSSRHFCSYKAVHRWSRHIGILRMRRRGSLKGVFHDVKGRSTGCFSSFPPLLRRLEGVSFSPFSGEVFTAKGY